MEKVIDISKCSVREPEEEKAPEDPYNEFPERITELPTYDAWENYKYLCKAEVLGIPMEPHIIKWKDDYVNGRIPGLENHWWEMHGRYIDDPTTVSTFDAELEYLRQYVAEKKTGGDQ